VQIDSITGQGNKLLLTAAMEAQAKSGHDLMAMSTWSPHDYANNLSRKIAGSLPSERRGYRAGRPELRR